jgi:hypothetical protein
MIVGRLSTVACSSTRSGVSPSAFLCVPLLQSSDSVPYIVVCLFTVPGVHAVARRGASLRAVYLYAGVRGVCIRW